ncbi:GtrA family protein [uncultured Sneathiella sp.]|uniref:GtrA family protein n=1 Tax=uncultured Sneathiella sp. TaxID=879315 RepID=UPI0030ECFC3F|tara:strand:+ start:20408 stop:20806 length:399 start_codon:yes stop_codon:yes gene_type:complete
MIKIADIYQMFRYAIVGVLNNLLGYVVYLLVTYFWLEPKVAVTILYPIGVLIAYFSHAKYSFSHQGDHAWAIVRFFVSYFICYWLNLSMLYFFSDKLGYPHQIVQAVAIVVVGGVLFLLLKFFVFWPASNKE